MAFFMSPTSLPGKDSVAWAYFLTLLPQRSPWTARLS
jgi:hypothetical protein